MEIRIICKETQRHKRHNAYVFLTKGAPINELQKTRDRGQLSVSCLSCSFQCDGTVTSESLHLHIRNTHWPTPTSDWIQQRSSHFWLNHWKTFATYLCPLLVHQHDRRAQPDVMPSAALEDKSFTALHQVTCGINIITYPTYPSCVTQSLAQSAYCRQAFSLQGISTVIIMQLSA